MNTASLSRPARPAISALPLLYMLLWGTSFVAAKFALASTGPQTLMLISFAVAAGALLIIALLTRAPWPDKPMQYMHLAVVGLLLLAVQFTGLYSALNHGIGAGESALIVGLMPLCVAIGGTIFLGERFVIRHWIGLAIGLLGVWLVVGDKVHSDGGSWLGYQAVVLALVGITLGTLYQRRFAQDVDLRTGGVIQLATAALLVLPLAWFDEGLAVTPTPAFVLSTAWLSFINAFGAIILLFMLVRKGEANKVASLFYLVPGITAVMGAAVLGETLTIAEALGFAVTAAAVFAGARHIA